MTKKKQNLFLKGENVFQGFSLQVCKISYMPNSKDIADEKINLTEKINFVLGRVENVV